MATSDKVREMGVGRVGRRSRSYAWTKEESEEMKESESDEGREGSFHPI